MRNVMMAVVVGVSGLVVANAPGAELVGEQGLVGSPGLVSANAEIASYQARGCPSSNSAVSVVILHVPQFRLATVRITSSEVAVPGTRTKIAVRLFRCDVSEISNGWTVAQGSVTVDIRDDPYLAIAVPDVFVGTVQVTLR